jgi:hypothetical protein
MNIIESFDFHLDVTEWIPASNGNLQGFMNASQQ